MLERAAPSMPRVGSVTATARRAAAVPWWAPVLLVVAAFSLGMWALLVDGPRAGYDSPEIEKVTDLLDREGRLPTEAESYEYWLPPGVPALGVALKRTVGAAPSPPRPLLALPQEARRALWLLLAAGSIALLATPRLRRVGAAAGLVALAWAACYALLTLKANPWAVYPAVSFAATVGLVAATALVVREAWPGWRHAAFLGAAAAAAIPILPRMGLFIHPDPYLALLTALALAVTLRAARTCWPVWLGLAVGVLLGLTALVRPSAPLVIGSLAVGIVLIGRKAALSFAVVAGIAIIGVAGPWWAYQGLRTGNPIQSNLDRPGYMLDHQPRSFYVSFPIRDLVVSPYRPRFENELFPRFHAELWSDWGGTIFDPYEPSTGQRVAASSQSVLGFAGDALVLGGFAAFGLPALLRAIRRRAAAHDVAPALLATLFVLTWIGFVATLMRYPQAGGDPIKSNYIMFLIPAVAVFAIGAVRSLWRRGTRWRAALSVLGVLYAASYLLTWIAADPPLTGV